jgi:hypothetical protein
MAWTAPRTWTPGELVTALMMNQHVRDNLNFLKTRVDELAPVSQTTTLTGTQNNFNLTARNAILDCNNASALMLTGLTVNGATPQDGDRVKIISANTTVKMTNGDLGSTAGNRFGHPQAAGQILGQNGIAEYVYNGAPSSGGVGFWRPLAVEPGAPINVAYSAGNFTASAGTWTVDAGDQLVFNYQQRGKVVRLSILINTSTVSGVGVGQLRIALPNGFLGAAEEHFGVLIYNNLSQEVAEAFVSNGATFLAFSNSGGSIGSGTWTNSTNGTSIRCEVTIQIQ